MEADVVGTLITFLLISCAAALFAEWIRIPHTIALVFVGLVIALTKLAPEISISKEVTFNLILPPLLFQGALHMDLGQLKKNWKTISILAVLSVLTSVVFIGYLIHWWWGMDLFYGLLFGALITPTDPISVLALLKKAGAPERLRIILEGESLFNDGTGVVIFTVIAGSVLGGHPFQAADSIEQFFLVAGGSVLLGLIFGYAVYKALGRINDHLIEVTLTVVLAFGTNIIAEHFHLSGIITVVVAGLIIGNYGRELSMSRETRETVETFWAVVDFIINSLIFLIIGIELQVVTPDKLQDLWRPAALAVCAALLGRAISIYPFVAVRNLLGGDKIPRGWPHVLFWGGLKGSIPLALVVGMDHFEYRQLFLTAAFGVVLFSLVVQGLTIPFLLERLGLSKKPAEN